MRAERLGPRLVMGRNEPEEAASPVGGEAMDRRIGASPLRRVGRAVLLVAAIAVGLAAAVHVVPAGTKVDRSSLSIATVQRGDLRDEVLARAIVAATVTVMLDATDAGRVEEVAAKDGSLVRRGDFLLRLSNPQRQQEALARASEVAQQLANMATLRAALTVAQGENQRRIADLEFELEQSRKAHARNVKLARDGFISAAAFDESLDRVTHQGRRLSQAVVDAAAERETRVQAIQELDRAIEGLKQGLGIVHSSIKSLSVASPADGLLTGFHATVGMSVRQGDNLGRIESPGKFKLVALVDEFYLARVKPGLRGTADVNGEVVYVEVIAVSPQVKDRRVQIELAVKSRSAAMQLGQSVDVRLTLGASTDALLLADGAFLSDTDGAWVYVLNHEGDEAERRGVRLGRRTHGRIEVTSGLTAGERVIVSSYAGFGTAERLIIR